MMMKHASLPIHSHFTSHTCAYTLFRTKR